jgi:uncharacterized protein YegL
MESQISDIESPLLNIESPLLTPTVPKGQPSPFLQPMQHTPIQIPSFGTLEISDAPRKTKRNCDDNDDNDKSFIKKKLFTENLPFDIKCVRNRNYGVITLKPNQINFIQKRYEITIALDKSYSMYGFKIDKLKELLHNIILLLFDISSDKNLEFMITIITYNDSVRIISEVLITKDTNKDEITSVLDKIKYILASGGTNFEDLFNFLKNKNGNFLIITDGEPTSGITNESALVNILNDRDNEGNKYYLLGIGVGPSITFFNKFITNINNSYYYCLNDVIKELGAYVSEILVNILYNNGAIKLEGNCLFLDIEHNRLSPVHTVHLTTQPVEVVFQCLNEEIEGLDDNENITCLTQALNITFQNVNHTFRVEETNENIDIHIWRFRVMQLMSSCNELLITNNDKTCLIEQCKEMQDELVKYITENKLESNLIIIQLLDHVKMCLISLHTTEIKQAQMTLDSRLHSEDTQSTVMTQDTSMSYDCCDIDDSTPSCLGNRVISAYSTPDSITSQIENMLLEKK